MARAALKQRGSLLIWFDPETVWLALLSGKRGRPATFTDAAIQACLTLKAPFGLPLRQTTGLLGKERQHMAPGKLLAKHNRPVIARAMQLENALCKVNADNGNFRHGCPLFL